MRRGSVFNGLRSLFNRAVRRVKAFFGWNDRAEEAPAEAIAMAVAGGQPDEEARKKGDGDDDDDGGCDAMPSPEDEAWAIEAEDAEAMRIGYYPDGTPFTYAKPPGMSIAKWKEKLAAEDEARKYREAEARAARARSEDKRKLIRYYEEQMMREQRHRISASQRRARLLASLEEQPGSGHGQGGQQLGR